MSHYNLIDEKWIPCIMPDGKTEDFGLQEVLARAHEIKELLDSSPLVTVSLHRLLLAILHRNFGPSNLPKWQELWNRGAWDENVLKTYFIKWRPHLYLFDEERPFYQCKEIQGARQHPVTHLALESASGNNATLFDHSNDTSCTPVQLKMVVCYLLAAQAFAIGGGVNEPFNLCDSPLTRGFSTMALGNSLFETLALNLLIYNREQPFPTTGHDSPAWEQNEPATPDKDGSPINGYLDYLTWQSRRIHLFLENDNYVRTCQIQQNLKLPKQSYTDPFKTFRKDKEKGLSPKSIIPDKALWRNSHILLQNVDQSFKRPEIFNWLARIDEARLSGQIKANPTWRVNITGFATEINKAASVLLWRHERLPLPLQYLHDEYLVRALKDALEIAEKVGKLLSPGFIEIEFAEKGGKKRSIPVPSPLLTLASEFLLKDQNGKTDLDAAKKIVESLSPARSYWAYLGIAFNRFMVDLAADKEPDGKTYGKKTLPDWAKEIRKSAWNAFVETARGLDRTGRALKAVSLAENEFSYRLKNILKDYILETKKGGE